jgi:MFS family permease
MVFNASRYTTLQVATDTDPPPGITILSKWFRKNGIKAVSLTSAGSGLGGTCFPLLINKLLPEMGYARTILVCVVIQLVLLGICCITMTMPEGAKHEHYRVNILGLLRKTQYLVTAVGSAFFICGYYTVMGFLVAIAHERGLPNPSLALAIASACR